MKQNSVLSTLTLSLCSQVAWSFQPPKLMINQVVSVRQGKNNDAKDTFTLFAQELSTDELKSELTAYLQKREEANADEVAKE